MNVGDKKALKNANKVYKIIDEKQTEDSKFIETIKFYDEIETYELEHGELYEASRDLTEEEKEKYKDR